MSLVFEAAVIAAVVMLSLRRGVFLVAALLRSRPMPTLSDHPSITVLVPAWHEAQAAERLLSGLARLDYPHGELSFVLVCDGCTDNTPALFHTWANGRSDARVVELPQRAGKPAALNAGLDETHTDLVVVLDADLAPRPNFLVELVRPFADGRVVAAAAYLRPANADRNIVTRYAAVTTWVHQLVTSAGTDRLGLNPPTLGAAAYCMTALRRIGGFPMVPIGEDVATSAALISRGGRTRFVATAVADNIVVSDVDDYLRQHVRWSRGVFGSWRPGVRGPWAQRLESAVSTIGYGDRLVFAAAVAGAIAGAVPIWVPFLYLAIPGLEIVAALLKAGVYWKIPSFLFSTAIVFGLDVLGAVAAVVLHLARRPSLWHSPRTRTVDVNANR